MSSPAGAGTSGDLTPELMAAHRWTDDLVAAAGIPVTDVPFTTVGGGIGSFVLVDLLRIAGIPTDRIAVLTGADYPWQQYEYLTRCSQLPRGERIRSDSTSIPDNVWGFPSLALRECWQERTLRPLGRVLTEPVLADVWTPRLAAVVDGMAREATRIGWSSMVTRGQARLVRRRVGGGYFVLLTPPTVLATTRRVAVRSRFVHLAVGSPGVRFLDDLQAYRTTYQDTFRVVNAYEPHDHLYAELQSRPGTVVVRGGGMVASRVLQRLVDDRDRRGARTTVLHILGDGRTDPRVDPHDGPDGPRRREADGWAHQSFAYPKSAWGGQHAQQYRDQGGFPRLGGSARVGDTTTPRRRLWRDQLARGRREGWYRQYTGTIELVEPGPGGTVVSHLKDGATGARVDLPADFVIDCSGLEADVREHRILADLLDTGGAGRNALGRLDVDERFVVQGAGSAPGELYASGSMTLGGPVLGVDTFLGLQLAALAIVDDLAGRGFGQYIGVTRSVSQWWRRMTGREP